MNINVLTAESRVSFSALLIDNLEAVQLLSRRGGSTWGRELTRPIRTEYYIIMKSVFVIPDRFILLSLVPQVGAAKIERGDVTYFWLTNQDWAVLVMTVVELLVYVATEMPLSIILEHTTPTSSWLSQDFETWFLQTQYLKYRCC